MNAKDKNQNKIKTYPEEYRNKVGKSRKYFLVMFY